MGGQQFLQYEVEPCELIKSQQINGSVRRGHKGPEDVKQRVIVQLASTSKLCSS